jgi:hypothetical protein
MDSASPTMLPCWPLPDGGGGGVTLYVVRLEPRRPVSVSEWTHYAEAQSAAEAVERVLVQRVEEQSESWSGDDISRNFEAKAVVQKEGDRIPFQLLSKAPVIMPT